MNIFLKYYLLIFINYQFVYLFDIKKLKNYYNFY